MLSGKDVKEKILHCWSSTIEMYCFHDLLLIFKDYFHISLSEDEQGRRYLELIYAGAPLKDSWSLADVGISFCSTLKCSVKV